MGQRTHLNKQEIDHSAGKKGVAVMEGGHNCHDMRSLDTWGNKARVGKKRGVWHSRAER